MSYFNVLFGMEYHNIYLTCLDGRADASEDWFDVKTKSTRPKFEDLGFVFRRDFDIKVKNKTKNIFENTEGTSTFSEQIIIKVLTLTIFNDSMYSLYLLSDLFEEYNDYHELVKKIYG